MTIKLTTYPALTGDPVTEGHARMCREQGHATHTIDGVVQPRCPRCGDLATTTTLEWLTRNDNAYNMGRFAFITDIDDKPAGEAIWERVRSMTKDHVAWELFVQGWNATRNDYCAGRKI